MTALDLSSVYDRNTLFTSSQNVEKYSLNDLDHGRSSDWVPIALSRQLDSPDVAEHPSLKEPVSDFWTASDRTGHAAVVTCVGHLK